MKLKPKVTAAVLMMPIDWPECGTYSWPPEEYLEPKNGAFAKIQLSESQEVLGHPQTINPLMRSTTQSLLTELQELPLLRNIGQPNSLPHQKVNSWRQALALCDSENWNSLQLMTKNRHATMVNRLNWNRFQSWNSVCGELRPQIERIIEIILRQLRQTHEVTSDLKATISWDVLCILLEREFNDVISPAFYTPILLPIYEAGHLPCGWTGPKIDTDWSSGTAPLPSGEILIY